MIARGLLLTMIALVSTGCRFGIGAFRGAGPRAADTVAIAVIAADERSRALTAELLVASPHVTPHWWTSDQPDGCDGEPCPSGRAARCAWAARRGLEYLAEGSLTATYASRFVCDRQGGGLGALLDKREPPCEAGHEEDAASTATYELGVYRTATCQPEL